MLSHTYCIATYDWTQTCTTCVGEKKLAHTGTYSETQTEKTCLSSIVSRNAKYLTLRNSNAPCGYFLRKGLDWF